MSYGLLTLAALLVLLPAAARGAANRNHGQKLGSAPGNKLHDASLLLSASSLGRRTAFVVF